MELSEQEWDAITKEVWSESVKWATQADPSLAGQRLVFEEQEPLVQQAARANISFVVGALDRRGIKMVRK